MTCPYLAFRDAADGRSFDHERPYCGVAEAFVEPMRADICRERFGLAPAEHCEIYREHESLAPAGSPGG
ncbi:MAG: hypothetical protein ABEJ92_04740 [Halobacteriales archaeon]